MNLNSLIFTFGVVAIFCLIRLTLLFVKIGKEDNKKEKVNTLLLRKFATYTIIGGISSVILLCICPW